MSPKDHTEAKQLPKTGETESSLATLFGALATATGLAFLAKRKKDDPEDDSFIILVLGSHCQFFNKIPLLLVHC